MNVIFKCCYTMLNDLQFQLKVTKVVHLRKNCRTWRRMLKEKSNLLRMASWLEDMELYTRNFFAYIVGSGKKGLD